MNKGRKEEEMGQTEPLAAVLSNAVNASPGRASGAATEAKGDGEKNCYRARRKES